MPASAGGAQPPTAKCARPAQQHKNKRNILSVPKMHQGAIGNGLLHGVVIAFQRWRAGEPHCNIASSRNAQSTPLSLCDTQSCIGVNGVGEVLHTKGDRVLNGC